MVVLKDVDVSKDTKRLIRLALRDKMEWEETALTKSCRVETSQEFAKYIFQKDVCSSFLIKSF